MGEAYTMHQVQVYLETSRITGNESVRGWWYLEYRKWSSRNKRDALISNNKAELEGGGIYNNHKMIIRQSTIAENEAEEEAGGIRNRSSDSLLIVNSTISSNRSQARLVVFITSEPVRFLSTIQRS